MSYSKGKELEENSAIKGKLLQTRQNPSCLTNLKRLITVFNQPVQNSPSAKRDTNKLDIHNDSKAQTN